MWGPQPRLLRQLGRGANLFLLGEANVVLGFLQDSGVELVETAWPQFPYGPILSAILAGEEGSIFEELIVSGRVEQLAPDVLVARVQGHRRNSYDVEREGVPPAFVLEIVSPESKQRDLEIKPERYERMGVEEYALFAPRTPEGRMLLEPQLQGYQRAAATIPPGV